MKNNLTTGNAPDTSKEALRKIFPYGCQESKRIGNKTEMFDAVYSAYRDMTPRHFGGIGKKAKERDEILRKTVDKFCGYFNQEPMSSPEKYDDWHRDLSRFLHEEFDKIGYGDEKMISDAEKYLEYAYTLKDGILPEITSGNFSSFVPAFANDTNIISRKMLGIPEIHIYSVSSNDGIPKYDVSVNADTEIIYYDEYGERKSLYDNYRISVKFSGSSENDIHAVSGKFELDSPVYPEPEPIIEENQEQNITTVN